MVAEEKVDLFAELNVFVRTPQGFEGHIKVMAPQKEAAAYLLVLSESLAAKQFEPSQRMSSNGRGAAPAKAAAKSRPARSNVTCIYCDGETWDNRTSKRNPKQPDYKCKDKDECGGAAWIKDDGELKWVPGDE